MFVSSVVIMFGLFGLLGVLGLGLFGGGFGNFFWLVLWVG